MRNKRLVRMRGSRLRRTAYAGILLFFCFTAGMAGALGVYGFLLVLILSAGVVSVWLWRIHIRQAGKNGVLCDAPALALFLSPPLAGCLTGACIFMAVIHGCLRLPPGTLALGIAVCTGPILIAAVCSVWVAHSRQGRRV